VLVEFKKKIEEQNSQHMTITRQWKWL